MAKRKPLQEPGPGLDLGPLPSLVGYALRRAQLAVFADFYQDFAPLGLRPAQFSVLLLLRHNPGARASEVAAALGIQRANFTTLLRTLQTAGLVERLAAPGDSRAVALHLSPAGAALLVQADAALQTHEARWKRRVGAVDYRHLLDTLGAMVK